MNYSYDLRGKDYGVYEYVHSAVAYKLLGVNVEREVVSAGEALVFAQEQPDEVRPLAVFDALVVQVRARLVGRAVLARPVSLLALGAAQRAERFDALLHTRVLQRRVQREGLREDALEIEQLLVARLEPKRAPVDAQICGSILDHQMCKQSDSTVQYCTSH